MQARSEPKLHPETVNMDFEKVTANRSATLKAGLKAPSDCEIWQDIN